MKNATSFAQFLPNLSLWPERRMLNSLSPEWSGFAEVDLIGPEDYEFGKAAPNTAAPGELLNFNHLMVNKQIQIMNENEQLRTQ